MSRKKRRTRERRKMKRQEKKVLTGEEMAKRMGIKNEVEHLGVDEKGYQVYYVR